MMHAFPEIELSKVLSFPKAFKVLSTVLARRERCWTLNCKVRVLYRLKKATCIPCNGFHKLGKRKKYGCANAALHFSLAWRNPHEQL